MIIGLNEEQKQDKKHFEDNFRHSWYYEKLKHLDYEEHEASITNWWHRDHIENIYDGEIFWYLQNIFAKKPEKIYDIGCGNNFLKKTLGNDFNIIALDIDGDKADEIINYQNWFKENHNRITAAVAINSLHFESNFINFTKTIESFISIFDKEGIGFITINFFFLIRNTRKNKLIELFGTDHFNQENFEIFVPYVENKLKNMIFKYKDKVKFDIVDIDKKFYRNHVNGNIRLLFNVFSPI
jgi:hypothetical protein